MRSYLLRNVVVLALAIPTILYGYLALFGQFSAHDDEGYVIQTVRLVLDGHPLFDETITCYGPFLYLGKWLLHRVLNVPLTNDATRFVTLASWAATSAALGWVAWRLTGRISIGALAHTLTFFHLRHSIFEPGHPQELCGLGVALVAAVACGRPSNREEGSGRDGRRHIALASVAGASVAAIGSSKVNVGLFLGISCLLAMLADEPRRWPRLAWWGVAAFALVLPFLLMRPVLNTPWGFRFAAINALGTLAVLVTARPRNGGRERFPIVAFLGSGLIVALAACGYAMATGTTPFGLLDGIILTPMKVAGIFVWPARTRGFGVPLTAIGAVAALIHARWPWPSWIITMGKLALAAIVVAASLRTDAVTLVSAASGWLWLALVDPDRDVSTIGRRMLVSVAVLQPLQAYPVPGSQFFFGTVLSIVVALVGLGDVLDRLESRRGVGTVWLGLAVLMPLALFGLRGRDAFSAYRGAVPLPPRQADRIRATEAQAATITWLIANLDRHADTFLCTAGANSLYLWTGKPAPTAAVIGSDINGLTIEEQNKVVAALERSPRPVVIHHPPMMESLSRGEGRAIGPIERHVADAYETVGRFGSYQFRVRRGRPAPELRDCGAWTGPDSIRLRLAPRSGPAARRAALIDLERGTTLAEAGFLPNMTLMVPARLAGSISEQLVIRLTDASGRRLLTVPVLARPPDSEQNR